jgi:hypothetical protein
MNSTEKNQILPGLIIATVISLALIICTVVLATPLNNYAGSKNTVTVTGAAKKQIRSDLIVWRGSFSAQSPQLPEAYSRLSQDHIKVKEYLVRQGIAEKDIVFTSIQTIPLYQINPNGIQSNILEGYRLFQSVEIKSSDVEKITSVSRTSTELINQGVIFESQPPQYFYTKLNDLKITMLGEAAKDARLRAEQLANNSGGKIEGLRSSKMGVFQITPLNSTEVSDYGINDTSSLEKEITAVINVEFYVK